MVFAALALILAQNPATMAGGIRGGAFAPAPIFTAVMSAPASECDGAAIVATSTVTHTNASVTRYCTKTDGTVVAMTANQPRVTNAGILVEGARTNVLTRSREFDHADWTAITMTVSANSAGATDPLGTNTAEKLVDSSGNGGGLVESVGFVPGQTTLSYSVYMKEAAADIVANGGFANSYDLRIVDTTAGNTVKATCTGSLTSAWVRYTCSATGLTAGNTHALDIVTDVDGYAVPAYVWGAQVETPTGNFTTSLSPSVAAALARANDVYTWSNATDITAAGCLSATVTFGQSGQFGGAILSNGTEKMLGTGSSTTVTANDGTNTVTATVADLTGRTVNIKTKWTGSTMTVVVDGVATVGSFDGSFSSTATMRIGATSAGAGYANAYIGNIKAGTNPESCN